MGSAAAQKPVSAQSVGMARLEATDLDQMSEFIAPLGQKAALESELATQFLLAANQAGAPLDGQDKVPNAVAIQRAQDWIMSNLAEQITRAELSAISGLRVRTLTRGFQFKYGVSPMQFVRDRRLDAVRNTLLAGPADEISVTRVAEDYGLYHFGRFSHDYRLRFHELPIRTLKR